MFRRFYVPSHGEISDWFYVPSHKFPTGFTSRRTSRRTEIVPTGFTSRRTVKLSQKYIYQSHDALEPMLQCRVGWAQGPRTVRDV